MTAPKPQSVRINYMPWHVVLTKARQERLVSVDPRYFRPTEVEALLGDPTKAKKKLGWTPKTTFAGLVAEMVREDLKAAERDELIKHHGFKTMDCHE